MVDIIPFKAQQRMNDACKNNYFRHVQSNRTLNFQNQEI